MSTALLMSIMGHWMLIFLCFIHIHTSFSELRKDPYEYSECQSGRQQRLGVQDGSIKDSAMKASSHKSKRDPWVGRLGNERGAWSPSVQNSFQWLQIDLGKTHIVTAVYLQGRQGSDEYVREFFLEYSDDEKTWRVYTNQLGIPEVFEGNMDDSTPQMRLLVYPVMTRFLRFNPQRWNMVIAMRVEIVGCPYESHTASFDLESYVEYDMSEQGWQRTDDKLEMRFRTDRPNGMLLYASGTQGDLIMLELKRGYMFFKINLGSTAESSGMTEVTAGSLLDDNQWHDVVIVRNRHKLTVVVDRLVNEIQTNGLFYRLDLDKKLYLGGVPFFNLEGITIKTNFRGCIQNLNFNGALMVRDANSQNRPTSIDIINNVNSGCNVNAKVPITFPTLNSHMIISAQSGSVVHVSFDFRTYNADALLVYHKMEDKHNVVVMLDRDGYISYKITIDKEVVEDVIRNNDILSNTRAFTDGLWHSFSLYADRKKINCTVDHNSKVSSRQLAVTAGSEYSIGGHPEFNGFKGCIRNLYVAQKLIDPLDLLATKAVVEAQIGTCSIRDRCTPNPCEHNGICHQTWSTFRCNCDVTGYKGEMCHTSAYHISCEMHKQYSNIDGKEETMLDPDGSGPMDPFLASCKRNEDGEIITYIGHDSEQAMRVVGYSEPGSYVRKITYTANDVLQLQEVIERSRRCQQNVIYKCHNARFLDQTELDKNDNEKRTWGWWVGRTFQPMYYWGGAAPGSGKCKCGLEENGCGRKSTTCMCDGDNTGEPLGPQEYLVDQGHLVHKEYLPVLEVHFGDTDSTGAKWAEHQIGPLECYGDNLFDNTVTFDKRDGTLEFPTFEAEKAGDIWFQFKTTVSDGVLIHCTGEGVADFLEIRLFQADSISFRYDVGNGVTQLNYRRPSPFNDDQWHTVHVEKNRKQAWMKVDDNKEVSRNEDADLIRRLDLSKPLTVGALIGGQDGFVGCMRGLRVNGKLMDMMSKLRGGNLYGVKPGCVGKCASSPCFHQGTCREGYDRYTCDCSYTPWRGWNCGREVGVNLKGDYMVKYIFDKDQGLSATDFSYATIGFSTSSPRGILMQITNEDNTEYISVEMSNSGGIKVAMDVGFERVEKNMPVDLNFATRQVHILTVRRFDFGRGLFFQVDNYPPFNQTFTNSGKSSKSILDNPKYLYVGNNGTGKSRDGFEGCIFRMQVDNIFPLKRAFQDPQPDYINLIPDKKMREDMCGFEEITVSPEPIQTRPYKGILQNVTYRRSTEEPLSEEEKALVGVGCALFVILVACIVLFCCRSRLEGADYETEEAVGVEYADDRDHAVLYNQTGLPNMPLKFEYFM